ncbi:MAG: purine-binding chemotaxis protein CheW [Planctomycetes bacterium]|nr:purine-binding chemotaxis protein CheW [Planctomycetota bacterium]
MDAVVEQAADESGNALCDARDDLARREGKFLTFRLGSEEFGVEVLKVRELIGIMDITKVPQTHAFVEGVINLRGKVIPVIDLRTKFGLERAAYNDQTCVIVVDVGSLMGIIVDTVCEVHDIPADNIEPPPELGCGVDTTFILGLGKVGDEVKILLDIDSVLNAGELVELSKAG